MNQDWDLQDRKLHDDEQRRENEVTRSLEHDEDQDDSCVYRVYTPQLMDTQEMQALRMALNRIEMQIQEQGHMQEYAPRKTTSSKLRQWYGLPRNSRSIKRPTMSAGPSSALNPKSNAKRASPTKSPHAGLKTVDFERTLKEETRQVCELESRYADTKRSLLEYIEIVATCKPNERVGGQDIHDQLADLMAFVAECSPTKLQRTNSCTNN